MGLKHKVKRTIVPRERVHIVDKKHGYKRFWTKFNKNEPLISKLSTSSNK